MEMPGAMTRIWPIIVVRGVLMAGFGIATLVWPQLTAVVMISIFGFYAIIDGLMSIGYGMAGRRAGRGGGGWISQGVIAILAGLIALIWPKATGVVVLLILGFWALMIGLVLTALAFRLRQTGVPQWWYLLVIGLIGVVFGLVMIFEPVSSLLTLLKVVGFFALVGGILLVVGGFRLRSRARPA